MAWKVGNIQHIDTGLNGFTGPGFVLQQDGRSPALTVVFNDQQAAKSGREALQSILDSAAAIIAPPR